MSQSYEVWSLGYTVKQTELFYQILGVSLPFDPFNDPKIQNFQKMKKDIWRYYLFTRVYHKWRSYDKWFLRYWVHTHNSLSFQSIFCPFVSLATWKINILNQKKYLNISSFFTITSLYHHIMYESWDMEHGDKTFSHFGPFLPFLFKIELLGPVS